ncbi:MAG: RNA-guided endonuclease InsQ/TnpB family protein, partial [Psychrobacter celer]
MKTLKLRIKDKHATQLNILAGSVNFVWNYVNELSFKHLQRTGKFFSAYDLAAYTKGSGEYLNLHSQTLQAISETHAKSRKQFKKAKLNWRTNNPKAK